MLNVPFALVGAIAALWLRGMHLNLSAAVGMIAVFGVAILNGWWSPASTSCVRQASRSQTRCGRRPDPTSAGARHRCCLQRGFLPMALSTSTGAEVQRPLATVVIGGLVSSTLLTLLVLPTVYGWIERRAERAFR
jgi:cobalt-zinc-cadmium resistance protein CzcA